jgi:hypothetical protein
MEDNHCVILEIYPSNLFITRIHMTSNIMFPLTLKLVMKREKTQDVYEAKYVNFCTPFKEESEEVCVHCSKEEKITKKTVA